MCSLRTLAGYNGADCNKTRQSEHSIMWHKWEADDDVAVKLTSVTDDVLKSNNGAHSYINFNFHLIIPEGDEYKS